MFCSIIIGIQLCKTLRDKVSVCDELLSFCKMISLDISYSSSSVKQLIDDANINYLSSSCLQKDYILSTILDNAENKKISEFLYSLGKSNIESQRKNLGYFEEYLTGLKEKYEEIYISKSKMYFFISVCCGLIVSIVLI